MSDRRAPRRVHRADFLGVPNLMEVDVVERGSGWSRTAQTAPTGLRVLGGAEREVPVASEDEALVAS